MERLLKSRFRIGEKISENPFSITYKGSYLAADRPLVVKIYKRGALNSSLIRDMKQKVKEFTTMNYHGIARLIDGDYGWQGFYYVREYIHGQSLKDLLDKGEKLELDKAVAVIEEAAKALETCHKRGIVHGAIKPSNIFIEKKGVVKLADFMVEGAIKDSWPQKAAEILEDGQYVSPEERLGLSATYLSDIYSLGLVLSELLGKDKEAWPKYLKDILEKALQQDPRLRIASAGDFRLSLENKALIEKPNPAQNYIKMFEQTVTRYGEQDIPIESESLQDVGQIKLRWSRERHRKWILTAVLSAAVLLGIIYAFLSGGR